MVLCRKAKTVPELFTDVFELRVWSVRSAGAEELAVLHKRAALTTKVKPLLSWDNHCWLAGAERSVVVKRPASRRQNLLGSVSSE